MTTARTPLPGFLLARIAEDEAHARSGDFSDRFVQGECVTNGMSSSYDGYSVTIGTDRVLAECEAKRRIVALHEMMPVRSVFGDLYDGCCANCTAGGEYGGPKEDGSLNYCDTLRALALPYADHPDYREEWAL